MSNKNTNGRLHQPRIILFANKSYFRLVNPAINISVIPLTQTTALSQTNKPERGSYAGVTGVRQQTTSDFNPFSSLFQTTETF